MAFAEMLFSCFAFMFAYSRAIEHTVAQSDPSFFDYGVHLGFMLLAAAMIYRSLSSQKA